MICGQEVCRDARFVRPFSAEQSTCSLVYSSTVNHNAGGRTARASLHAFEPLALSTILRINSAMTGM